jgi:CheY-like chemotaxis protein
MTNAGESELHVDLVHEALQHLYSNVELASSTILPQRPSAAVLHDPVQRAQALRSWLLDGIEALRPSGTGSVETASFRYYRVLCLRYVSELQVRQISERLALSERQVYRDLGRAEEQLAEVLRARLSRENATAGGPSGNALRDELDALLGSQQETDLAQVLDRAIRTLQPLAEECGVTIEVTEHRVPMRVMATAGALGHILVRVLSMAIRAASAQTLGVALLEEGDTAIVRISPPATAPLPVDKLGETARLVGESVNLECRTQHMPRGLCSIELSMPLFQPQTVLIVDDNPGMRDLLRRYLQGTRWQAVFPPEGRALDEVAVAIQPAAIVLDVLMPDIDGWSMLQTLRLTPGTAHIPVIVCSVVSDPELAADLGAAASLPKPLSRVALISTLMRFARPENDAIDESSP